MPKYLIVEHQDGGCDYTIGCGVRVTEIDALNPLNALDLIHKDALDSFADDPSIVPGGEGWPDRVEIYTVQSKETCDWYRDWLKEFQTKAATHLDGELREQRRRQFEILRQEFGDD